MIRHSDAPSHSVFLNLKFDTITPPIIINPPMQDNNDGNSLSYKKPITIVITGTIYRKVAAFEASIFDNTVDQHRLAITVAIPI